MLQVPIPLALCLAPLTSHFAWLELNQRSACSVDMSSCSSLFEVQAHLRFVSPNCCRAALRCSALLQICSRLHFLITSAHLEYRQSATWKCTRPPHDTTTAELVCRAAVSGSNRSSERVTRMMFIRETFGCCDMSGYCRCRRMPPVRLPNLINRVVRCSCCSSSMAAGGMDQSVLTCASLICRMPH